MQETLGRLADCIEEVKTKFYGVVTGKVINLADPMALGRAQVQLPFIDDLDLSPWARVVVPMAGIASGMYFIPNPGDEVLVAFEHGDVNAPYIIGSLWTAMAPPPLPSPLPQIRMIRTPIGNQIIFTEIPGTITLQTPTGETIVLAPAGVQVVAGANLINMTPDGITINGTPNLTLTAAAAINITAPNVSINGATATDIKSAGVCKVTAPIVKIN